MSYANYLNPDKDLLAILTKKTYNNSSSMSSISFMSKQRVKSKYGDEMNFSPESDGEIKSATKYDKRKKFSSNKSKSMADLINE